MSHDSATTSSSSTRPTTRTSQGLVMTAPRVTWRQAIWIMIALVQTWLWLPRLWSVWVEPVNVAADYRTPSGASQDYWQYQRVTEAVADRDAVLVVGDSVIWGEYVDAGQTLSDELSRTRPFANGGLNGLHPLAMQGLLHYHVALLASRRVVVHFNPLWLTSDDRDLRTEQSISFNHPDLVPQRAGAVPAYRAATADRLSVLVERHWPWRQWVRHIRLQYFNGQDPHRWSLEHPYSWPDEPDATLLSYSKTRQKPLAWTQRAIRPQNYAWVSLADSLQWQAFRAMLTSLLDRDVKPLVLVGPFNTHLLTPESKQQHDAMIADVGEWLTRHRIPYVATETLASEFYADASHPLAEGYRRWAEQIVASPAFGEWNAAP